MSDLSDRLRAALVDRYTLERELGRGGMAVVYLAEDRRHQRKVALGGVTAGTVGTDHTESPARWWV